MSMRQMQIEGKKCFCRHTLEFTSPAFTDTHFIFKFYYCNEFFFLSIRTMKKVGDDFDRFSQANHALNSAKPVQSWRLFHILVGHEGWGNTVLHLWHQSASEIWGKLKSKARQVSLGKDGKSDWGLHKSGNVAWEGGCPAANEAKEPADVRSTLSKNNGIV